jgi:formylglycine-generating enzyme required for sulfatase activity
MTICGRRIWGSGSAAGKIIINYRRVESLKDAQHLKTLFDKTFGAERVFLDVRGIDGGANWLQTLERQVAASAAMVVLIGKDWTNLKDKHGNRRLDDPNDFVRFEISQAPQRNLPIVPVSVDGAAVPEAAQLPGNLVPLSLLQAMPLRTESFTQDAQAIAERLRVLLEKQQRGVPVWGAGLGLAAALAAGVAVGPMALKGLGLPFPGVTLPGDAQLRAELNAAQNRLVTAEDDVKDAKQRLAEAERAAKAAQAAQQTLSQRLAAAEKERDQALKEAATAESAVKTADQRLAEAERAAKAAQAAQQALSQRVAAAEKERDEARKEVTNAKATIADFERKPGSIPVSGRTVRDCSDCPEMVVVPAGKFMMGSMDGASDEKPVREVTIGRSFAVGKFEVTFADWEACVAGGGCTSNKSPSDQGWGRGRRPVIDISWNDAKEYVTWLARKTGQPYRLLTEAEWEYAARAGTTTKYAFGDAINKQQAQFSESKTAEVGSFPANAWALYDMHGNVWEWVEDCYQENYNGALSDGSARSFPNCSLRVLRGGSWYGNPQFLRSALRNGLPPVYRGGGVGFRVARTL